nr:hypothetical protein [Citrobacter freundii]
MDPQKYKAAADALFHREPKLTPRLDKWTEDMSGIQEEQFVPPRLIRVNEINDIWLEIPRYENVMWGGGWISIIVGVVSLIACSSFFFLPDVFSRLFIPNKILLFFYVVSLFFLFSFTYFQLKIILLSPRGAPIRLSRSRQKIYIYDYQRRWNPWVRWPTTIRVFDWVDIHGEMTREVDRYDQGYRLYGAVCYPGTNEVRERFVLSYTVGDPTMLHGLWSHCCQYMQGKEVPPYPLVTERPKTWALWDTVRWPEEIDKESRTAPGERERSLRE